VPVQKCPYHVTFDLDIEHTLDADLPGDHRVQVWWRSGHLPARSDWSARIIYFVNIVYIVTCNQCCCQGLETQGQGQGQGLTPALIHTLFCMCNMKNNTFKTLFLGYLIFCCKEKNAKIVLNNFLSAQSKKLCHLVVYCHSHVSHKERSALDIKDIRDNNGLLAVTRMSSSIEQAIIKPS